MTWHARLSVGWIVGVISMSLIGALDIWLVHGLLEHHIWAQRINFLTFLAGLVVLLSLPALLFLAYQTVSCLTLRYHLDRNGIVIRWAGTEQIIPIRNIQRIVPGHQLMGPVVRRRGPRWPGHERGIGSIPGIGRTCFLATRPLSQQLLLVTPGMSFAISPREPERFLQAFEARRELGPNRLLEQEMRPASWLTWPFWRDRTAWILLGAALIINLGLFGYLSARFPRLDIQLPLHFNRWGQVDRIGTKMELFTLPIIGLIILGTNTALGLALYKRERAGSYLLWGAAAATQALFWLATFSVVP